MLEFSQKIIRFDMEFKKIKKNFESCGPRIHKIII